MTPPDEMPDDADLARIAAGDGSLSEDVTYAQALAAEVLRLRERVARAETVRDDAADAFDALVRRVWEAATGDTHEGPASVDVLLEAVAGLRARADGAEAARDALRAAAGSYLATVTGCAATGELLNDAQAAYERTVDRVRAEPGSSNHRTEVAHAAVRLSAAGLAYIDADLTRDAARERLRTLAGEG